jgi:Zn-dependent protease
VTGSFKVARIGGIDVEVHYTWLFALVLIAWSLGIGYFPSAFPSFDPVTDWLLGLVSALLLFVSVLIHELSHSLVAIRRGLRVRGITLFILGGVSNISGEPRAPADEFAIALVGPLTSLLLAAEFWGLHQGLGPAETPASAVSQYLAFVNLLLGVFNLLPGFPLDGGRVLRSIVWGITRNFPRATQVATFIGQGFGWLLIGWGVVQLLAGDFLSGMWTAFLGWFLNNAAEATRHAEVAAPQPVQSIAADTNLSEAPRALADQDVQKVWVVEDGRVIGILSRTSSDPARSNRYRASSRAA